jgi:hypothetical protein
MSRLYGAGPLHLLAHLALLPLAAWALLEILGGSTATRIVIWLVACVIAHDLILWPLYTGGDRALRAVAGRAVNYVRIPAALSLLMLVVFFGTIGERGEAAYRRVSGLEYDGYATRWLLVSAALFIGSALLYLGRSAGARRRPSP